MVKKFTAVAFVGALSIAAVPMLSGAAFAQAAAGPEPMQGAQPMDNAGGGGSMSKGSDSGMMKKKSMKKHSMKKMKHHKSM